MKFRVIILFLLTSIIILIFDAQDQKTDEADPMDVLQTECEQMQLKSDICDTNRINYSLKKSEQMKQALFTLKTNLDSIKKQRIKE